MRAPCSPHISVEHIEAGLPSSSAVGIDVTSVLLETWCAHELQWVLYEPNTPLVWTPSNIFEGTSAPYGCQVPCKGTKQERPLL